MKHEDADTTRLGRPFWALVVSSAMSNLADGVYKVALPLLALHYTRSPALVAGVLVVQTLPWLLGALPIGAVIDRSDRRRTMVIANAARAAFVAIPAIVIALGGGGLWMLYVTAAGTGFAEVFYDTAAQSMLPSLVAGPRLDRANGRLFAVELGAQEFAGPPIGGVLVAAALAVPLAASAGLWVIAIAALLGLRGNFKPRHERTTTTIRADVREGLSFLVKRRVLRTMALMVGINNLASSAVLAVFVLYFVGPDSPVGLSEPGFGLLLSVLAAGGLIGALVAERVTRLLGRSRTMTVSLFGMILYVAGPAATTNVVIIGPVLFVGGLAVMLWNVATVSFRQRVTPEHLLGRVNSAYRLVAWGTRPIGAAIGGALGQWVGVRTVFAIMGAVAMATLIPNRILTDETLEAAERDVSMAEPEPVDI
jgi:MFS family permease